MFLRIIKKDLIRKKVMNVILLIFIIMASMFLASSLNNIVIAGNALDYYIDKGGISDYTFVMNPSDITSDDIEEELDESEVIDDYEHYEWMQFDVKNLNVKGSSKAYESSALTYITTLTDKYNYVYDSNDEKFKLNRGEIAFPMKECSENSLKEGDKITLTINGLAKSFTIKYITKDAFLGAPSSIMGVSRFIVSDDDFNEFKDNGATINDVFSVKSEEVDNVEKLINDNQYSVMFSVTKDDVKLSHYFDIMIAYTILAVSIVIILISFLVLRFTVVFTLENDYKQIGIMKAIGIKNIKIRFIYLAKYLAISLIGSIIGLILSFPLGDYLLNNVKKNIIMEDLSSYWYVNFIASIVVVFIVIFYCYRCTGKLNKFSAIEAIRNSKSSERNNSKRPLKLNRHYKMKPVFFMAVNDVLSNLKRYIILIITFAIGISLTITPNNITNTMAGEGIFSMADVPIADFYVTSDKLTNISTETTEEEVNDSIDELKEKYKDANLDINIYPIKLYSIMVSNKSDGEYITMSSCKQSEGYDMEQYDYDKGVAPKNSNEVAVASKTADELKINIGDSIYFKFDSDVKEYKVTAIYQSIANNGKGIRLSENANIDYKHLVSVPLIVGNVEKNDKNIDMNKTLEKVKKVSNQYTFYNFEQYVDSLFGTLVTSIKNVKVMINLIVILINACIVFLMEKSFISKERKEISMLKNLGFTNGNIRAWQTTRILICMVFATIIGIVLSIPFDYLAGSLIFGMFGASNVNITSFSIETYILYPVFVLLINMIITWFVTFSVKKVTLMDIDDCE